MKTLFLCIIAFLCFCCFAMAATTSFITYTTDAGDIVFTFDDSYEYGQYASGDYWVVGPLTINAISPNYTSERNGWEVNPTAGTNGVLLTPHGFDGRVGGFDSELVPSLPYAANPSGGTISVVKCISSGEEVSARYLAACRILTVVAATPDGNGEGLFRPPYVGTVKPEYAVSDIDSAAIPNVYTYSGTKPKTLSNIESYYTPTLVDHLYRSGNDRDFRPVDTNPENTDNYVPDNAIVDIETLGIFYLDDATYAEKLPALKKVIQRGIDMAYIQGNGGAKEPSTGHTPTQYLLPLFASVLLDISPFLTEMDSDVNSAEYNDCEYLYQQLATDSGVYLYGQESTESAYWTRILTGGGNAGNADPYGYVDGGDDYGGYYSLVIGQYKYALTLVTLMPAMRSAINSTLFNKIDSFCRSKEAISPVETNYDILRKSPDPCSEVLFFRGTNITPTVGNPTVFEVVGHGLSTGDTVSFVLWSGTANSLFNTNSANITKINDNSFSVPINSSGLTLTNLTAGGWTYNKINYGYVGTTWSGGNFWGPDPETDTCILDTNIDYYNSPTDWACSDGQHCGRWSDRQELEAASQSTMMADLYNDYIDSPWSGPAALSQTHGASGTASIH